MEPAGTRPQSRQPRNPICGIARPHQAQPCSRIWPDSSAPWQGQQADHPASEHEVSADSADPPAHAQLAVPSSLSRATLRQEGRGPGPSFRSPAGVGEAKSPTYRVALYFSWSGVSSNPTRCSKVALATASRTAGSDIGSTAASACPALRGRVRIARTLAGNVAA